MTLTMLPTVCLPEIRHRTQFSIHWSRRIPSRIQGFQGLLCILLILVPCIHIPNEVVPDIIAHMHLLQFSIQAKLRVEIFVELVKVFLDFGGSHGVAGDVLWIEVDVTEEDGLRVVWFDVFAGAAVAMAAGPNFVVERAVYFVGFGAVDGRKRRCHGSRGEKGRGGEITMGGDFLLTNVNGGQLRRKFPDLNCNL